MKRTIYSLILMLLGITLKAQTTMVTGNVRSMLGNPLHFAFVQDKQTKTGTYTDQSGNFALSANAKSSLIISCAGFKDTSVLIAMRASIIVRLSQAGIVSAVINNQSDQATNLNKATLRDQINLSNAPLVNTTGTPVAITPTYKDGTPYLKEPALGSTRTDALQGAIFPVFSTKEETRGSRYLFPSWAHGYVINSQDSLVQSSAYLFNYDKIGGGLLLTQDGKSAIEIDRDRIKSFTLYGPEGQQYTFEYVPAIDKGHFVQVLDEGNKYKIYKRITVEFVKSDYATNGLTTTGNPYDEYVDKGTYYVVANNGTPQQIVLKKKALKEVFSADADKFNKFLKANSGDIDDNYLIDAGAYMNR